MVFGGLDDNGVLKVEQSHGVIGKQNNQSLWIERKLFCAFSLIPGRSFRVMELLENRSFSADFMSNEIPWLIRALREAGNSFFGAAFYKKGSFGRRSTVVTTETNRAGVYIKVVCSCGGSKRRQILIPSGDSGEGWFNLANLLASITAEGESVAKSSFAKHRTIAVPKRRWEAVVRPIPAVKGKERLKDKLETVIGWREGFLSDFLKLGLELSLGDPSSSVEASRYFAWKPLQSEQGFGILVVEKSTMNVSLSSKTFHGDRSTECKELCSGSEGSAGADVVVESSLSPAAVEEGVSIFGNLSSDLQKVVAGDESLAGVTNTPFLSSALVLTDTATPRVWIGPEVNWDKTESRVDSLIFEEVKVADHQVLENSNGFGPSPITCVPTDNGLDHTDKASFGLFLSPRAGLCTFGPRQDPGLGSSLVNPLLCSHLLSKKASDDSNFLARHEDITIIDNEEELSLDSIASDSDRVEKEMSAEEGDSSLEEGDSRPEEFFSVSPACDSPASYCSGVVVKEKSSVDGFSYPEEYCLGSVHYQRSFKIAEMLRQSGFFQNMDRAVLQAHIIKDLLQDA